MERSTITSPLSGCRKLLDQFKLYFPFTLSNTLPLQCKGLTCLAVLTLEMLEGCRAGDAHAQVAEF